MNVFYIHEDPKEAARLHIWHKHVVKMILEYAQLLSTAHRLLDGIESEGVTKTGRKKKVYTLNGNQNNVYNATHINHPSAVWVRANKAHYCWVYECMMELGNIYKEKSKSGNEHLTITKMKDLLANPPLNIPDLPFEEPPQAMDDKFKVEGDSLAAYKKYYEHKREIL